MPHAAHVSRFDRCQCSFGQDDRECRQNPRMKYTKPTDYSIRPPRGKAHTEDLSQGPPPYCK